METQPPRGIYRRGETFWCRARVGGQLRRRSAGRTLEEAEQVLADLRAEQQAARSRTIGRNGSGGGNGSGGPSPLHDDLSIRRNGGSTSSNGSGDRRYPGALGGSEPIQYYEQRQFDGHTERNANREQSERNGQLGHDGRTGYNGHGRIEHRGLLGRTTRRDQARPLGRNGNAVRNLEPQRAPRDGSVLRVGDLYRVWAEAPRVGPLRHTTKKGTRLALARFAAWAGENLPVTEITQSMVETYASERRKQVAPISVQSELRPLSAALNAAVDAGYIKDRPYIRLSRSKHRRTTSLEKEEVQVLLEVAADEGANADLAIRIALCTGLRHQEVLHLRRCDCRLGERPNLVVAAWGDWEPKRRKRELPINRELADRLASRLKHLPDQSPEAPLFQHSDGHRMGSVARAVADAFKYAGLYRPETRPGLHCLRRTWATHVRRARADFGAIPAFGA